MNVILISIKYMRHAPNTTYFGFPALTSEEGPPAGGAVLGLAFQPPRKGPVFLSVAL